MDSKIFEEIYEKWIKKSPGEKFWKKIKNEYGFGSDEAARSAFKRYRQSLGETKTISYSANLGGAKVAVFDLEFSPMICYSFDLWNTNISVDQILSHPFMISWAAKLLNESHVYSDVLTSAEAISQDDERITRSIWEFLKDANVVIGQNIRSFDLKKLNTRALYHNIPPLPRFMTVDTLSVAKEAFAFPSRSLKYMNRFLGLEKKQANEGFPLWDKCMKGDSEALHTMDEYCKQDVVATEDLYFKIRPYVKAHPNLALFFESNESRCPNCGSTDLVEEGFYFTPAGKWASMRCNDCGALSRSKQNELEKDKKKSLYVN